MPSNEILDISKEVSESRFLKELEVLREGRLPPDHECSPELEKIREENIKLKYRLAILKRSIVEIKNSSSETMVVIPRILEALFQKAVYSVYPELGLSSVAIGVSETKDSKFGDYQCNIALTLTKHLKKHNLPADALVVAKKLIDNVPKSFSVVEKLEIAGPGFINVFLAKEFILEEVRNLLTSDIRPPKIDVLKRVAIDMSSPNIAKEMHVGHLRSTIIGDSISNICQFVGHTTLKINHLGDWGTQFGMLIAHLVESFPNYLNVSPPIHDLQKFYKESKVRFDTDEEFKQRSYSYVVKLQNQEEDVMKAWRLICQVSRENFQKIYACLGIHDLLERGESFYQDRMHAVVSELKRNNLCHLDEGRLVMWSKEKTEDDANNIPLTLVKSDGGFTYDTSDMATLKHRIFEDKANWLVYVVDSGQRVHFDTLFACAQRAGYYDPAATCVEHVSFGVVLGADKKKFKTRSGDTVKLTDLLDQGFERSAAKLKEKGRDQVLSAEEFEAAKKNVAIGCIKYADLSHNRINDYVFSFDRMLDDRGNTAVYLLYTLTRIRSIGRVAAVSKDTLLKDVSDTGLIITEPAEWKLSKFLLKFSECIVRVLDGFRIHLLCEYMYELSCVFSEFYDNCYCVEKNSEGVVTSVNASRLLLCEATADVLDKGFNLLGITSVHRM